MEIIFAKEQYDKYYYIERFIGGVELSDVLEIIRKHDKYRMPILDATGQDGGEKSVNKILL